MDERARDGWRRGHALLGRVAPKLAPVARVRCVECASYATKINRAVCDRRRERQSAINLRVPLLIAGLRFERVEPTAQRAEVERVVCNERRRDNRALALERPLLFAVLYGQSLHAKSIAD